MSQLILAILFGLVIMVVFLAWGFLQWQFIKIYKQTPATGELLKTLCEPTSEGESEGQN